MTRIVRNSARPSSTWLEGVDCVPSACRRKCSTTVMRRNGVIDITAAGSSVISVSRMTICIGTLSEAPFLPAEIPRRENGSLAAPMAGSVAARPHENTQQPHSRGLRCRGAESSPPASSRRARMPPAVRSRPHAPGAACAAGPAAAAPGISIRRAAALLRSGTPATPRRRSTHNVAPSSSSTSRDRRHLLNHFHSHSFRPAEYSRWPVRSRRGSR